MRRSLAYMRARFIVLFFLLLNLSPITSTSLLSANVCVNAPCISTITTPSACPAPQATSKSLPPELYVSQKVYSSSLSYLWFSNSPAPASAPNHRQGRYSDAPAQCTRLSIPPARIPTSSIQGACSFARCALRWQLSRFPRGTRAPPRSKVTRHKSSSACTGS